MFTTAPINGTFPPPQFRCEPEESPFPAGPEDFGVRECMFCADKWPVDELVACCECGRVCCLNDRVELSYGFYCPDCSICRTCGRPAMELCENCGDPTCSEHYRVVTEHDPRPRGSEVLHTEGCVRCLPRYGDAS